MKNKSDIYFTKNDPEDLRYGDIFKVLENAAQVRKGDFVVLSYEDDEGVRLNGGRPGACLGPENIRRHFFKMTPCEKIQKEKTKGDSGFWDDHRPKIKRSDTLSDKHSKAQANVGGFLKQGARVATLGGGHDYAFPDLAAFCDWAYKNKKIPYVINFDAHLDVRPSEAKGPHSGTGFYKLLKAFPKISFYEVGIQDWCNSVHHLKWAKDHGAKIIKLEEILSNSKALDCLKNVNTKKHALALSVDIDVFASAFAPGASQVFPMGLDANLFLKIFVNLIKKYNPKFLGIYEVNPNFDVDGRTAKLAAILLHQYLEKGS